MRLIAVRHGQTLLNTQGRFSGQLDTPLSDLGKRQVEALGERLALEQIEVVGCSTLQRARETALAIARHHHLPLTLPRLKPGDSSFIHRA
jgi:broad specificity phosphatase PhoE